MNENIVKRVVAVFLVMLGILAAIAVMAMQNIQSSISTSDWVNHTHAVIMEVDAILSSLHRGDAALRSFLLTADARDQKACREAYTEAVDHLAKAKALTRNEPFQNKKIMQLEPLLSKRVDFTREAIKMFQQDGLQAARKIVLADATADSFRQIQTVVDKLNETEKDLLRARDKTSYLQAQNTRWTVMTGMALNFLLLAVAAWLLHDDIEARQMASTALHKANEQLEGKVDERTTELAQANRLLKAENLERQWANQSLEHQLRYSQIIINSINDLIFVTTKALNITRVNPAVAHLTGLEPKELISGPLSRVVRLVVDGPASDDGDPIARALKDGRDLRDWPAVVVTKYNQSIPCLFNMVPLRDNNKVVGGVVTVRKAQAQP